MIEAETGSRAEEFVAIGGGAASALWLRILAAALGRTVRRSTAQEASSLGAAICAATGAGWFASVPEAAAAMSSAEGEVVEPDPQEAARYAGLLEIYRELYPKLRDTFAKLGAYFSTP